MLKINTRVKIVQCACRQTDPLVVGVEGVIVATAEERAPGSDWDWVVRFFNYSYGHGNAPFLSQGEGFFLSCMLRPIFDPKAEEFLKQCLKPNVKVREELIKSAIRTFVKEPQ